MRKVYIFFLRRRTIESLSLSALRIFFFLSFFKIFKFVITYLQNERRPRLYIITDLQCSPPKTQFLLTSHTPKEQLTAIYYLSSSGTNNPNKRRKVGLRVYNTRRAARGWLSMVWVEQSECFRMFLDSGASGNEDRGCGCLRICRPLSERRRPPSPQSVPISSSSLNVAGHTKHH